MSVPILEQTALSDATAPSFASVFLGRADTSWAARPTRRVFKTSILTAGQDNNRMNERMSERKEETRRGPRAFCSGTGKWSRMGGATISNNRTNECNLVGLLGVGPPYKIRCEECRSKARLSWPG